MSRTDKVRVEIALEHIQILNVHLSRKGTVDEGMLFDPVCMQLSSAIESANGISSEQRESVFGAEWILIKAMRNAIAHDYMFVDPILVRDSAELEVPEFRERLLKLQKRLDAS